MQIEKRQKDGVEEQEEASNKYGDVLEKILQVLQKNNERQKILQGSEQKIAENNKNLFEEISEAITKHMEELRKDIQGQVDKTEESWKV